MKVMQSKLLGESVVIAESQEELDDAFKKAEELDAAVYTLREIYWITDGIPREDQKDYLVFANKIKKTFRGFFQVPKDFQIPGKE